MAFDLESVVGALEQLVHDLGHGLVLLVQNNLLVDVQLRRIVSNTVVTYRLDFLKCLLQGYPFVVERYVLGLKREAASK